MEQTHIHNKWFPLLSSSTLHPKTYSVWIVPRLLWLQTLGLCGTSEHLRGEPSMSEPSFSCHEGTKMVHSFKAKWHMTPHPNWNVRWDIVAKTKHCPFTLLSCHFHKLLSCWGFQPSLSCASENVGRVRFRISLDHLLSLDSLYWIITWWWGADNSD